MNTFNWCSVWPWKLIEMTEGVALRGKDQVSSLGTYTIFSVLISHIDVIFSARLFWKWFSYKIKINVAYKIQAFWIIMVVLFIITYAICNQWTLSHVEEPTHLDAGVIYNFNSFYTSRQWKS
jgi:hypothetical protein